MTSQTDLAKPGGILLLVGAILSAVGAVFMIFIALGVGALLAATGETEAAFIGWIYGGLSIFLVAGAIFGFMGYNKAREGDMGGAFVFGLISSMLPPVQLITLIGAIFCKVSEDQ